MFLLKNKWNINNELVQCIIFFSRSKESEPWFEHPCNIHYLDRIYYNNNIYDNIGREQKKSPWSEQLNRYSINSKPMKARNGWKTVVELRVLTQNCHQMTRNPPFCAVVFGCTPRWGSPQEPLRKRERIQLPGRQST